MHRGSADSRSSRSTAHGYPAAVSCLPCGRMQGSERRPATQSGKERHRRINTETINQETLYGKGDFLFRGNPLFYGSSISKHNPGEIRREEKTPETECKNKSYYFMFRSILAPR